MVLRVLMKRVGVVVFVLLRYDLGVSSLFVCCSLEWDS